MEEEIKALQYRYDAAMRNINKDAGMESVAHSIAHKLISLGAMAPHKKKYCGR